MAFVEDLSIFLADFGQPVVAGANTGLGILDMPGEYVLNDRVINNHHVLMAESLKFGAVSYGDSMTVEGLSYRVREGPLKLGDGAFCAILLERIEAVTVFSKLLLEDGFYFLLEDSSFLLLEA
jgi:hypothetical protein